MSERSKIIADDVPFLASMEAIRDSDQEDSEGGYLGDPIVLESLLRLAVSDFMGEMSTENARRLAQEFAETILGKRGSFIPVRRWNEAGFVDEFCARWVGCESTDAEVRMEQFMVELFSKAMDLAEVAETASTGEWDWQLDALFQEHVRLLLGIDPTVELVGEGGEDVSAVKRQEQIAAMLDRHKRIIESWKDYP